VINEYIGRGILAIVIKVAINQDRYSATELAVPCGEYLEVSNDYDKGR
jgi:hypothetical protein